MPGQRLRITANGHTENRNKSLLSAFQISVLSSPPSATLGWQLKNGWLAGMMMPQGGVVSSIRTKMLQ
jgi:hypothetical protein